MEKFDKFYFEGFEFDILTLKVKFFYSFDKKVNFEEEIDFSCEFLEVRKDFDEGIFQNLLFHLSLAIGVSYYKAYPTKELIVESGYLSEEDKLFWQKFYRNGLGEFLYTNNLNPEGLFNFVSNSEKIYKKIDFHASENSLLPLGGGKDSIVSAEMLNKKGFSFTPIIFGKSDIIKENCLKVMGKEAILIKRKIDENLFKLNEKGYYNGHVPITGIIAFVLYTTAYLYDYEYIILSNEKSANIGNTRISLKNVEFDIKNETSCCHSELDSESFKSNNSLFKKVANTSNGIYDSVSSTEGQAFLEVNHQYSKSLEFEQDLENYVVRNISSNLKYFSLLRGMYEIKIAEIFARAGKKYFGVFSSCNNNFRIKKEVTIKYGFWCNECPKCAFVYSVLRPFLTDKETISIFGKELYNDENLESLFKELLGIEGIKPFECVGEEEEVILSMYMHINNLKKNGIALPYILSIFQKEILIKYDEKYFLDLEKKLFKIYDEETLIPEKFKNFEI